MTRTGPVALTNPNLFATCTVSSGTIVATLTCITGTAVQYLTGGTTILGCTPCSGNGGTYATGLANTIGANYASCSISVAAVGSFGTISSVVCASNAYFSAANTCSACNGNVNTLTTTYPGATSTTSITLYAGLTACSMTSGSYTAISSWTCGTGYVAGLSTGGTTNAFLGCYPCDGTANNANSEVAYSS